MHVEGDHDAGADLAGAALHQVLGEARGEVGLPRATGPRQDDAAVLQQQADVVLHHRLGDQRLEDQAVNTLLLQTWTRGRGRQGVRAARGEGSKT